MKLLNILLQVPAVQDTIAASKIQNLTNTAKAQVDAIANPDSIAALTPDKVWGGIRNFDWSGVVTSLSSQLISLGLRVLAAILIFYVGKLIINKLHSVLLAVFVKKDVDRSLSTFLLSFLKITLLFLLIITVIGVMGIETSSFIAIFASAGVAIGMALSGTLQNFAGGVLILLIKPYKVGDFIEFGTYKGTVKEIQIFHTIITTINNERIIIPNGGLSTGTINNYSAEGYRRIEWRVAVSYGDDVKAARTAIMDIIHGDSRIVKNASEVHETEVETDTQEDSITEEKRESWWRRLFRRSRRKTAEWRATQAAQIQSKLPKPDYTPSVQVEELADSSVVLLVRAWAESADYWPVLYAINEQIYEQLPKHGLHFPFPQLDVHMAPPLSPP
ncbi:MAG: mechanosensitive ion channel [Muribaculaceae bacterium]|nr:mechanosensitive ion channel [Muribaculaceae bacterium]